MAKRSARAIAITGGTSGIACDVADEGPVKATIPFLISGEASYVKGQILAADGGFVSAGLTA